MTTITLQEAFDRIVQGFASQNWHTSSEEDSEGTFSCRYRTHDHRKCAVGWLIKDEEYVPELEGCSPVTLQQRGYIPQIIDERNGWSTWWQRLQVMHDNAEEGHLREECQMFAARNGLTWPEGL